MNHPRRTVPMVGRRAELERLHDTLRSDRPTPLLIGGDAGVGKTRLVAEIRALAEQEGCLVLSGHCIDFGDAAVPYLPFVEMFGRAPEPTVAEAIGRHPALARLVGRGSGSTDQVSRDALLDDLHAALTELGEGGPVLVVVEDVHWADRSTRDVLTVLFTRGFSSRVVLLVTYRSDDLHRRHPLRPTLAHWSRLGLERITLEPLTDAEITSLVHGLHPDPMQDGAVRRIVERAEGNAFFAEELVGAQCQGQRMPENLAELLLVRLDTLDDVSRAVVRAAAVAGRTVEHDVLDEVLDLEGEAFDRALRSAVDLQLLVPTTTGYQFRHALVAESIYDDLLPGERGRLHQRYVAVLHARPDAVPADLARHARAAGDTATAVTAGLKAATLAMKVGGPEEAVAQYEQVAGRLATDPLLAPAVDRIAVTGAWVEALMAAGHTGRAVTVARAMIDELPADTTPADRAAGLAVLVRAALMEESSLAQNTLQEALALLPEPVDGQIQPIPVVRARARLLAASARVALMNGRYERAAEDVQQATSLAQQHGWSMIAQDAATTAARLAEFTGDGAAAAARLDEVIRRAVEDDDIVAELRARHYLGGLHLNAGHREQALLAYREGADRARAKGRPWAPFGMDARVLAGIAAVGLGEWELAAEIVDVSGDDPPELSRAALAVVSLLLAAGRGDRPGAERLIPVIDRGAAVDGMIAVNQAFALIDLHGDADDLPAARAAFDNSNTILTTMWATDHFQARIRLTALLLGQIGTHSGAASTDRTAAVDESQQLATTLVDVFGEVPAAKLHWGPESDAWWARVEAERLRVLWLFGDGAVSAADLSSAWEQVVELFDALGDRFEAARSRARWAAALVAAGDQRAPEVAAAAAAVANELGARPLSAELERLGPLIGHRRRPAEVTALTARELQIVRLVADGRSNGEIGRQLFISTKTVSVHVSNLLAKLGARGRTEAAATARERGLL
ncbi:AAA family ATPase [Nakamurella sp. A5-74]|uniref:AAA family ATPase n=1 Tax=Nakamurella sp. A5-74 TaxID=3158264 RepID=A0AAU8DK21_9ACTN